MIYDCILYDGELPLLEIRLNETKLFNQPVTTVIICAKETHTGIQKSDYTEEIKKNFEGFDIFCYVLDNLEGNTPREKEAFQRNQIKTVLGLLAPVDDDIVIIADVDEIPRARCVNLFKPDMNFACLMQEKYAYFLNNIEAGVLWDRCRIMSWRYLKDKRPEGVRNSGYDFIVTNAGWHYSWVCDPLRKLRSFSHTELNTLENMKKVGNGENIWDDNKFMVIDINLSHPEYLYKNQEKFKHLIK